MERERERERKRKRESELVIWKGEKYERVKGKRKRRVIERER